MNTEQTLLQALHADPCDDTAWLALADWLEEIGQAECAELLRLHRGLRGSIAEAQRQRMQERIQQLLQSGTRPCVPTLTNSIGMQFVLIPPGTFLMGSPAGESERDNDEQQHRVEITRPFYLGVYPVTQTQWQAVMHNNPSHFSATGDGKAKVKGLDTSDFPVEQVSWEDATAFLDKLSALEEEHEARWNYRLPTEAEWEYACRGGTASNQIFHFGNTLSSKQANFDGRSPYGGAATGPYLQRTSKVGSHPANGFGLHDMHGNLWEWCSDWYDGDYYAKRPPADPQGPRQGSDRVYRGGGWYGDGWFCRSASRDGNVPDFRHDDLGFRAALVPSGQ
jgi:uncharacterized protein (TIGR02996 family)